jgi:hypothetical protein
MKYIKTFENYSDVVLYHGTSLPQWNLNRNEETSLYLSNDKTDAEIYDYETSSSDESDGIIPEPILCSITMKELENLDVTFDPDFGGNYIDGQTWEDTYKEYGSFSVYGKIDDIKQHFKITKI